MIYNFHLWKNVNPRNGSIFFPNLILMCEFSQSELYYYPVSGEKKKNYGRKVGIIYSRRWLDSRELTRVNLHQQQQQRGLWRMHYTPTSEQASDARGIRERACNFFLSRSRPAIRAVKPLKRFGRS